MNNDMVHYPDCADDCERLAEVDKLEADLKEANVKRDQVQTLQSKRAQLGHELDAESTRLGAEESQVEKQIETASQMITVSDRRSALVAEVPCAETPMSEECKLLADARKARDEAEEWRQESRVLQAKVWRVRDAIRLNTLRYKDLDVIDGEIRAVGYDPEAFAEARTSYEAAAALLLK